MDLEQKFQLVRGIGEECLKDDDELRNLLEEKPDPICYDGFEPSGRMHIAQGIMKAMNVNKLTSAGCRVKIWIADWFAHMNNKMGGDLEKIEVVGKYFIEIWKALGMDIEGGNVEFLWSSEEIVSRVQEYLPLMIDISRRNTLKRIIKCGQIMGRSDQDELSAAQIFYPCMQCADVFFLKADICQLGMDQRKVNTLAREYCDDIKRENKPIILSHHMLPGLKNGQEKMSKSDPSSSIFMEDEEDEVNAKIKDAHCELNVKGNPCLEYVKYMIFPWFGEFKVERADKNGGDRVYSTFEDVVADYESGQLHPDDLKPSLAKAINTILQPVRNHFTTDASAKDLLKRVKELMSADSNLSEEVESFSIDNTDKNETEASGSVTQSGSMDLEQKFQLVRGIGEECIEEDELRNLLEKKPEPICYDGFEPSGRMHIAQGIMRAINVKKLSSAGCRVKILIADWLAYLNDKMGGDLEKIEVVGNYYIEIWKSLGMDLEGGRVEFLWSSQEIISRPREYLTLMMDIARRNKLPRIKKCREIMGRNERDKWLASQIIYPCMQCADIFFLKADICQLGMDQKEVNLLAREYCDDIKRKNKPIILSHHMLPGLKQGQTKMSKSDPSSSIFMDDEEGEVNAKIKNAKPCEPKIVEGNPCLEYVKYLIFPWLGEFKVERKAVNGGDKIYLTFEDLVAEYESGLLHPSDLKPSLAKAINTMLQPVRNHFATDAYANDLLMRVKAYTR